MDVFAPTGSGALQIQSNFGAPSIKGVHVNALQVQQCLGHLVFVSVQFLYNENAHKTTGTCKNPYYLSEKSPVSEG